MNFKKYINMILLKLSQEYKITFAQITTYKEGKKYNTIKVILHNYLKDNKNKTIEAKTERELLIKLKEMI